MSDESQRLISERQDRLENAQEDAKRENSEAHREIWKTLGLVQRELAEVPVFKAAVNKLTQYTAAATVAIIGAAVAIVLTGGPK